MISITSTCIMLISRTLLEAGNIFFYVFHIFLILFNLFGWIPSGTRKWHLLAVGLTAFSWFVLGYFYGWGYCFLTDWHWEIRRMLGYTTDSSSYIHFLITSVTPLRPSEKLVDAATGTLFGMAVLISLYVNLIKPGSRNKNHE